MWSGETCLEEPRWAGSRRGAGAWMKKHHQADFDRNSTSDSCPCSQKYLENSAQAGHQQFVFPKHLGHMVPDDSDVLFSL